MVACSSKLIANLLLQVAPAVIEEIGAPLHFLSVTSLDQLHAQIGHVEVVHVCLYVYMRALWC